jgi:alkylhydroperoxidase/carboxymuconolactone decarboxylase family protein YurZ
MRAGRDREDLAGMHVRRARSVLDQVKGHRRKALAELGAAVEQAALTTATLAAVRTIADLEAGIDASCRDRFHSEIKHAIDALALMSGATATVGGRAELLHGRIRDLRQDDPSAAAIAYFLRTCRELIELMTPPAPAAELPVDPILIGIVEAKPRRARKAA